MAYNKEKSRSALARFAKSKDEKKSGGNFINYIDVDKIEEMGFNKFKTEPGPIFIAVLPRLEDPVFCYEMFVHSNVAQGKHYICPQAMYSDPCPVCDLRQELYDNGDDDAAKNYYPSKRYLMWVVDVGSKRTIAQGPYLWDTPKSVIDGIFELCVDERTGETIDVSDPEEGINIVFKRIGKALDTKYIGFKTEPREEDIPEEYYDLPPVTDFIIPPDIDKMKKLTGMIADNPNEEQAEEPVREDRTKKAVKPLRRARAVDEEEPEEDIEQEEKEPVKKWKRRAR